MNVEEVVGALKQASYGFFGYLTPYVLFKGGRMSKQTLRSASAVATFMGSFRLLKVFAKRLKYDPERKEVIQGLCGGLASSAACCVDPSFASPLFAFWFAVKGLREFLPEAKTSFYPLLTLITASAYTIPTGYVMPDEVHPSYRLFLEKWVTGVGVTTANWRAPPAAGLTLSDGVHPNQSMTSFLLTRAIPGCFVLATKFTFPLYLLTAIQAAITKKFNLKTTVVNFSRSVTFLAMYVSSCWVAVLWWSRYVGGKVSFSSFFSCFFFFPFKGSEWSADSKSMFFFCVAVWTVGLSRTQISSSGIGRLYFVSRTDCSVDARAEKRIVKRQENHWTNRLLGAVAVLDGHCAADAQEQDFVFGKTFFWTVEQIKNWTKGGCRLC
jgi:hypothetical protein